MPKKRIAVFLGGHAPEHDVSVISGIQSFRALDPSRYDPFLVYVATDGRWFVGEALRDCGARIPELDANPDLVPVTPDLSQPGTGRLVESRPRMFGHPASMEYDVALLCFHGVYGEDGCVQGLMELAGVPYTGMRLLASSIFMSKHMSKAVLRDTKVPVLPHRVIARPPQGLTLRAEEAEQAVQGIAFPMCVKPVNLGSSIGVARVTTLSEFQATLPSIFRLDTHAMVEPFVANLVEYNVAVMWRGGSVVTSAIERPERSDALLDFKQKYRFSPSGGAKFASDSATLPSEGLLSLTREINPSLSAGHSENIRHWATDAFVALGGTGVPRFDFLCNGETGQIWLNEANPCPGSMGFFLWEAAEPPLGFTALLDHLIDEALQCAALRELPADPVPVDARLLRRPGET